ncbi:MAG: hypothetical protein Ct9H300mP10_03740 [Methanobacteriota archaeon]|nr:MAG: hypothetical protein Ct9H300mP10_03740 [Euryarchaeota archaeon]
MAVREETGRTASGQAAREARIVEYEREKDEPSKAKVADRSHLEDASFKDAMALLGSDTKKK